MDSGFCSMKGDGSDYPEILNVMTFSLYSVIHILLFPNTLCSFSRDILVSSKKSTFTNTVSTYAQRMFSICITVHSKKV
jgi:hypothetical protein